MYKCLNTMNLPTQLSSEIKQNRRVTFLRSGIIFFPLNRKNIIFDKAMKHIHRGFAIEHLVAFNIL